MSGFEATIRRAKARLSDFTINEVSLVDKAANLRNFVVTKKDETMANATQKMTLKLPAAAKQGLQDGLGQIIDKVTALASVIGDAETDDAAAVPEELSTALTQIGQMASGMAGQYGGAGSSAAGADTSPQGTGGPNETPPATNPAPDMGKNLDGTAKNLPPEHKDPGMKTELHDGDSLSTIYRKAIAKANLEVAAFEAMEKAGRKMAGARYKKLAELHDNLGKLLNELAYDEAAETKGANEAEKAKTPPPPPKKDDKTEPAAAAKSEPSAEMAQLQKELADLRTQLGTALAKNGENETKITKLGTELSAVSKAHGVSNAGSIDGPASGSETKKNIWEGASDMSAHLAKKRAQERAAANGATK
jgi:hypothetical protein